MPIEIKMPALSPTMEEGTLAKWLVKEGDTVKSGDIMAEIETDKATMEFEAVDEGTIGKVLVAEGTDNVKVGAVIAILLEEGEDASAIDAAPMLLRNDSSRGHWLTVACEAPPGKRVPLPGTRVEVRAGGRTFSRDVTSMTSVRDRPPDL